MNLDNVTKVEIEIDVPAVSYVTGWCLVEDKEVKIAYNDYVSYFSCPFCGFIGEQAKAAYHVLLLSTPLLERLRSTQKVEVKEDASPQDAG